MYIVVMEECGALIIGIESHMAGHAMRQYLHSYYCENLASHINKWILAVDRNN